MSTQSSPPPPGRRRVPRLLCFLPLLFLCGCFQVSEDLTIQPDGSGTVKITTRTAVPQEMMMELSGGMGGGPSFYPPLSEGQARQLFPSTGCKVTTKSSPAADGQTELTITAEFKDINALLSSPYGHAHGLSLKIENGVLHVQALSGLETAARSAEMDLSDNPEMGMMAAGLGEARKKTNEMRSEFHLILPNPVTDSNGDKNGKTASWIAERAKAATSDAFTAQLGRVLEASCSADGLKFAPVTPPRLNLLKFADLQAGVVSAASGPDPQAALAAAKFIPQTLTVQRSLDLTGAGGGFGGNQATLTGVISIPRELAPARWGGPKLEEATDAKGANLKNTDRSTGGEDFEGISRSESFGGVGDPDEPAPTNMEHSVSFTFKAPAWQVQEITRVKGSVHMEYLSGSKVIKLANAIPASWIKEMKSGADFGAMDMGEAGGQKTITNPELQALNVSMDLSMGIVEQGMTMLNFSLKGKASFTEVQVFDADGKPWPTTLQNEGGNSEFGSLQIMVTGRPKAPLSMAVISAGSGGSVDVPILVEHIPVRNK